MKSFVSCSVIRGFGEQQNYIINEIDTKYQECFYKTQAGHIRPAFLNCDHKKKCTKGEIKMPRRILQGLKHDDEVARYMKKGPIHNENTG